jgi:type VI secretion system protein ImpK
MNDDKTIFSPGQKPAPAADKTVFIPRPGGAAPPSTPAHASMPGTNNPASFSSKTGINPLVVAAGTLLAVITRIRNTIEHRDVQSLHQQLVAGVKAFDIELKQQNVRPEHALSARYMLCSCLDEAVLNTPWGSQSLWSQHSLLSLFHKETAGGEKFYIILSKMLETPAHNIEILELAYLLLSLGFEGRYKLDARGRDQIENIKDNLFTTIEQVRGEFVQELAPKAAQAQRTGSSLTDYVPLWLVTACILALAITSYSGFRLWLYESTKPTTAQLGALSQALNQTKETSKNND